MKDCYVVFKEAPSDVQRSWALYIRKIDRQIESALRQMVKRSMMELSRSIGADVKKETQALFKVAIVLEDAPVNGQQQVAFRPTMPDLTNLVNDVSRKLINTVKVIPRLTDLLEYKHKKKNAVVVVLNNQEDESVAPVDSASIGFDKPNFYDAIANDEDVLKTFVTIIQGMKTVATDMSELVAYWKDAYR